VWSSRWNENWQGKPKYSEKIFPSATWSTTNPIRFDLEANSGRRGGKPVTNLRRLVAGFLQRWSGFEPRSHVGFMVDKVALGQALSEYLGFPCQFSFHQLLYNHPHLSSGAGTIGQLVAAVPSELSLTPFQETKERRTLPPELWHGRLVLSAVTVRCARESSSSVAFTDIRITEFGSDPTVYFRYY
jgi:hypothetical protein